MMPPAHVEVGAFVLGVLDEEENELFEGHLAECASCQAELRELYVLPGLLDAIKEPRPAEPQPSAAVLGALLDDVAAVRRRRRRLVSLSAAAAIALIAVTPPATRLLWSDSSGDRYDNAAATAPKSPTGTEILQATNRTTEVTAKITIEPKGWGTQVSFELSGVRGPQNCQLVVVDKSGKSQVVSSWQVPANTGWGVPGAPKVPVIQGGTAFFRGDIERFEVRTTTGPNLVDVPA